MKWLAGEKSMVVHVEAAVLDDPLLTTDAQFADIRDKLVRAREKNSKLKYFLLVLFSTREIFFLSFSG